MAEVARIVQNGSALYIAQGEVGCISSNDVFDEIGSDDATTCHILILAFDHAEGGHGGAAVHFAACTHVDQEGQEGCEEVLQDVIKAMQLKVGQHSKKRRRKLDFREHHGKAYILGGFSGTDAEAQLSESILSGIKAALLSKLPHFRVEMELCGGSNTIEEEGIKKPRHFGASYNLRSGVFSPCNFPIEARGPAIPYRNALRSFGMLPGKTTLIDIDENTISVPALSFLSLDANAHQAAQNVESICFLCPKEIVISLLSTSPSAEPDHFVSDMQEMAVFFGLWVKLEREGVARPKSSTPYRFDARTGAPLPYPHSGVSPNDSAVLDMLKSQLSTKRREG